MALIVGQRLGVYEVIGSLGAGGMGEVYRARDTRLGRDVALKILPEVFASDPDRLARFEREAQVLPRSTTRTSPGFMGSKKAARSVPWLWS
jgi:serine/threonine protein kinase